MAGVCLPALWRGVQVLNLGGTGKATPHSVCERARPCFGGRLSCNAPAAAAVVSCALAPGRVTQRVPQLPDAPVRVAVQQLGGEACDGGGRVGGSRYLGRHDGKAEGEDFHVYPPGADEGIACLRKGRDNPAAIYRAYRHDSVIGGGEEPGPRGGDPPIPGGRHQQNASLLRIGGRVAQGLTVLGHADAEIQYPAAVPVYGIHDGLGDDADPHRTASLGGTDGRGEGRVKIAICEDRKEDAAKLGALLDRYL